MRRFATIAILAALVTGCVSVDSEDVSINPTLGQALIDLSAAYDKGLLSDEEFKRERRKLLTSD